MIIGSIILVVVIVALLLGMAFTITGALLTAVLWIAVKIPIGLVLIVLGAIFCCTIILIPLGLGLIKGGVALIIPG